MVTIPELVGKKTKKKTTAGRDVYKTLRQIGPVPKGSSVSELGVSIPLNKKKTRWLNAPSIYHGVRYTDDEIKRFYKQGQLKPSEVEIIEGSVEDAVRASKKRSSKLLKRAEGGPPKPRSTDLSKILKGISRVARDPRLTALEAVRYAFGVSPTQGTHDEELARRRIGSEALDQPESGLTTLPMDREGPGIGHNRPPSPIPLSDVYHQHIYTGGPHEWEGGKFDLKKVGTGEGHHAEGWGAYGGGVEDTGDRYRVNLSKPDKFPPLTFSEPRKNIIDASNVTKGETIPKHFLLDLEKKVEEKWNQGLFGEEKIEDIKAEQIRETLDEVLSELQKDIDIHLKFVGNLDADPAYPGGRTEWDRKIFKRNTKQRLRNIKFLRDIRGKITGVRPIQRGTLYRTSLPKHIVDERFLDSDLLISEQSPYVQKALKTIVEKMDDKDLSQWFVSAMRDRPTPDSTSDELALKSMWSGKSFYRELTNTFTNPVIRFIEGSPRYRGRTTGKKQQASEALLDAGIPGLKYFDQLSRREQAGTKNFVVWDQELLDAAPVLRLKATGGVVSKGGSTTVRNPYGYSPKAI